MGSDKQLRERLRVRLAECREEFPGLCIADEPFLEALVARVTAAPAAAAAALARLHVPDLYLAFGCAQKDPKSLALFEARYLREARQRLARKGLARADIDEVLQRLRERLFVASERRAAKIADYAGQGPLRNWLGIVLARLVAELHRERKQPLAAPADGELDRRIWEDLELSYLQKQFRPVIKRALRAALGELEARDRNLIRLYYVDGLRMDKVAALHRVRQPTISKWLKSIRKGLLARIRAALSTELGLDASEIESLLRQLDSDLEVSLTALANAPRDRAE